MFTRPEAYNVQVTTEFTQPQQGSFSLTHDGQRHASTRCSPRCSASRTINLSATSEVLWGIKKLNLALVLDNTGSMSSSQKMTNLKTAAHNLLTTLKNAAKQPGDIKVAIVPFATDVNAGTATWTPPGSTGPTGRPPTARAANRTTTPRSSCESHGKIWTPKPHSQWNGCVNDRDQNNDVTNTATVAGAPATLFRAHQASNCPTAAMMPLTEDWTALNARIDAMTPAGNTNVTIGLSWGFQLLSPNEPFNAPRPRPISTRSSS